MRWSVVLAVVLASTSARADGFYLNVSNYHFSANLVQYGTWISSCIAYATAVTPGDFFGCPNQYWNGGPLPAKIAQLLGVGIFQIHRFEQQGAPTAHQLVQIATDFFCDLRVETLHQLLDILGAVAQLAALVLKLNLSRAGCPDIVRIGGNFLRHLAMCG